MATIKEKRCYTVQEVQDILNISRPSVYKLLKRSDFRANLEISAYDRVITLSTCAYRLENARYVLHGKLMELR